MNDRLAHGGELLQFFLKRGYICPSDEFGALTIYHKDDKLREKPISIPSNQFIGPELLGYLLVRGGFTEDEFWEEVG